LKKSPLTIDFFEYQKIFRILHGIHEFANEGERPSCQFYSTVGAYILGSIYGVNASPRMGAAYIKVDEANDFALAFAHPDFRYCNSDSEHFHCWIETDNHYIDFTSPVYSSYPNTPTLKQRYMFQKPKLAMSESHLDLDNNGDFYFEVNPGLTATQMLSGAESTKLMDFAEIARGWVQASKKSLQKNFNIQASDGEVISLKASNLSLDAFATTGG
jgi:hypothetical protein